MRRGYRFAAVWLVILSAVLAACSDPSSEPLPNAVSLW